MNQLTLQILDVFQGFRMPALANDQYETIGKTKLGEKMESYISHNEPISFVMLGFPMKSINDRDKVLGKLPDLGEELALKNFRTFNEKIREVYSPGIVLDLVSDGYVFNDVMETDDSIVAAYQEICRELAKVAPINWYEAQDFYSKKLTIGSVREKIMKQFGITPEILEQRILLDPDVNLLYRGMIRFMTDDFAIKNFSSGNQLHKKAKQLAREMMFRNEAYSHLVQEEFKDNIRLSMHPSINNGNKFSFQPIPSKKAFASPWHSAILIDEDNELATIHRKDANLAGYQLMYREGRPYYFEA